MTDKIILPEYSREFINEFIELYHSQPSLWDTRCKEYYDRAKKSEVYELLIAKLKEVDENASRKLVTKRINSLRQNYRWERKKYLSSLKTAITEKDIYKPKLWYYNAFSFLDDVEQDKANKRSKDELYEDMCMRLGDVTNADNSLEGTYDNDENSMLSIDNKSIDFGGENSVDEDKQVSTKKNQHRQIDYAAKSWALVLNDLPREQQLLATRLINEVIFQAQMNKLNENSTLTVCPSSEQPTICLPTNVCNGEHLASHKKRAKHIKSDNEFEAEDYRLSD